MIKDEFYHQLTALLQNVRPIGIVVLTGDLNGRVWHLGTEDSRLSGQ